MSDVTGVLLIVHWSPSDDLVAAIESARFSGSANGNVLTEVTPVNEINAKPGGYGSGKGADARIWASGFNYARPEELGPWFAALPWGDDDEAVLTATNEQARPGDVWVKLAGCPPVHVSRAADTWPPQAALLAVKP